MKKIKPFNSRRVFINQLSTATTGVLLGSSKVWGAPAYLPNLRQNKNQFKGIQLGLITYSFRDLEDQSAEATLDYILECGANAVELMGSTAESFIGKPESKIERRAYYRLLRKERNNTLTQEETQNLSELKKQQAAYDKELERWKANRSVTDFSKLRDMYNAAGVEIYAFKPDYLLRKGNTDADINYAMQAGKLLGASHVTLELPEDPAHTLKLGKLAKKNGINVAYHGHEQQHANWWDTALSQSPHNKMNLDLGHYIAAGNTDAFELIQKQHQHILSMHVKDRQNPENGKKNMPFGQGDTPIIEVLRLMRDQKYTFAATVEYEYKTPSDSTILEEVRKSIAYCKNALDT